MVLLAFIPALLTIVILLAIMVVGKVKKQSGDHHMDEEDMEIVRVAVYDEKAYWVYDNVFYEAEVTREPDFETARPIDTESIPEKKMVELFAILDELKNEKE
jgi:hypothetical protein